MNLESGSSAPKKNHTSREFWFNELSAKKKRCYVGSVSVVWFVFDKHTRNKTGFKIKVVRKIIYFPIPRGIYRVNTINH